MLKALVEFFWNFSIHSIKTRNFSKGIITYFGYIWRIKWRPYLQAVLFHSDDDISLFVSCFDIPVSLDHLLKWIASINDRF